VGVIGEASKCCRVATYGNERGAKGARDAKAQRGRDAAKAQRDAYRKERHCAPNADYSEERQAWAARHCCCADCDPQDTFSAAQFRDLRIYKMATANGVDRWVRCRAEGQATWVIVSPNSGALWTVPNDVAIEREVRLCSVEVSAQTLDRDDVVYSSAVLPPGFLTKENMREQQLLRSLLMEKHAAVQNAQEADKENARSALSPAFPFRGRNKHSRVQFGPYWPEERPDRLAGLDAAIANFDPSYTGGGNTNTGGSPAGIGPTQQRADAGLPLNTRTPPEAPVDPFWGKGGSPEYADNFMGRTSEKMNGMRQGFGEKLGLDNDQMQGIGGGLQGLGQALMRG
jgi:hypothetical protein